MMILAVDGTALRLSRLAELLRSAFPEDTVITHGDPLAAGQYCYNNPVDVLFAALQMPRLDGLKLAAFVRHANPGAAVLLIANTASDAEAVLWEDDADGVLAYPLTEAALKDALYAAKHKPANV